MKPTSKWFTLLLVVLGTLWLSGLSNAHTGEDVLRVAKLLYDSKTEFVTNLSELCDGIGGRVTGSKQAERAVGWAIHKLNTWGIPAVSESYIAPRVWMEDSASSKIVVTSIDNQYPQVEFSTFIASMGYSTTHGPLTAPLLYVQNCEDSEAIQKIAKGKLLFMETPLMGDGLESINDVFLHLQKCETLTRKVGAAGVIFMGDRPGGLLYRYPSAYSDDVSFPMVTVLREVGERLQRLLNGTYSRPRALQATIHSEMIFDKRNASCSNVVAEIKGTERPEEIVLLGAHIDSWDLGTGALDNGCNAVALMSVMHAFKLAGIQPKRTIRLALFTGEEQMFLGSWGYVLKHNSDLDNHVLALVIDLGSGAVTSFTVNGRAELIKPLNESLIPVANLGPFEIGTEPEFGTDNYDFLMQGVSNIVAEQEPAEYTKSYHSAIDTFDKVNVDSVLRNEVILSAVALHFASLDDVSFSARQSRQDIQKIMDTTSFGQAIRDAAPPLWDQWLDGTRGRKD